MHDLRRRVTDRCRAEVVAYHDVANPGPAQRGDQAGDALARVDGPFDRPEQQFRASAAIWYESLRDPRRASERFERVVDRLAPQEDAVRRGGYDQRGRARRVLPQERRDLVPVAWHGGEGSGV